MGKSYHVLDLGGGIPKIGETYPQNAISNDSNCGRNIYAREWADICMVAYHRQKLRRITVGRGYAQMGEIWLKKWNFEWLELWPKYI